MTRTRGRRSSRGRRAPSRPIPARAVGLLQLLEALVEVSGARPHLLVQRRCERPQRVVGLLVSAQAHLERGDGLGKERPRLPVDTGRLAAGRALLEQLGDRVAMDRPELEHART